MPTHNSPLQQVFFFFFLRDSFNLIMGYAHDDYFLSSDQSDQDIK